MSRTKPPRFQTVEEAIKALEGSGNAARALGVSVERVCNWVSRGWFPNDVVVFVAVHRVLKGAGLPENAADHLFRPSSPPKVKRRRSKSITPRKDKVA